jgi:nitroreductase
MSLDQRDTREEPRHEPRTPSVRETMLAALDSAIRAPSTHNTQPWIFGIEDDPAAITLFADTDRALGIADPTNRELFISCGTVLHHVRVALAARGRACRIERLPDPAQPLFVARVTLGESIPITEEALALEHAIQERHTDNSVFQRGALSTTVLDRLAKMVSNEGARLHVLEREDERAMVADLVAVADRVQQEDPLFRDELAHWLRSGIAQAEDGITIEGIRGFIEPWIVRTFDRGDGEAARDRALILEGSPCIVMLSTERDTPMDWVRAGEALSALLLGVTDEELSSSYLSQVVEVSSTRAALDGLLEGRIVQVVLRVGHGSGGRQSARRPVRKMLKTRSG